MSSTAVLAMGLSLVAALLFAVASVLQDKGTQGLDDDGAVGAGFFVTLARRKVWVAGIIADIAGFGVQAWALAVGSLMLVQPLLVTTLLFALPMAALMQRRRLGGLEWFWALALTGSLAIFMIFGQPSEGIETPSAKTWIIPAAVLIPVVIICVVWGSRMAHGSGRSLVLALAAGVLLGVSAPLTKTGIAAFDGGFLSGLASWEFWAMAVTATLGTLWQQSSYQAGDVQTSLPTVTVLKPIIAMGLGLTIYHETLRIGHTGDVLVIVSLVVMLLATVMLGRLSAPQVAAEADVQDPDTEADSEPAPAP